MYTDINNEDRLVQRTIADYLREQLGWDSVYAWNEETLGPGGTLGRTSERDIVLVRDLREALVRLNPDVPGGAVDDAVHDLTAVDFAQSTLQHNQRFYKLIREGVPVSWKDQGGQTRREYLTCMDFRCPQNNRFLAVRELWIKRLRGPDYRRRADIVCFVNGLPLVFIELKAIYVNIRAGFDNNITDYKDTIPHAFYHNAFLVVSNGDRARYGSITAPWDHFYEWKRNEEKDEGRLDTQMLLDGMLSKERLLDLVENFILFDASKPGETRKVVPRNHQVLGVNRAVDSVRRQEGLKKEFPPEKRLEYRVARVEPPQRLERLGDESIERQPAKAVELPLVERAHPDLGRLGVFWHTFVGCGVADENTPRAGSGKDLESLLRENHRYVFSLIHKFNRDVSPNQPYSRRDDIIVISDEAHRTQGGKLARNMRLALPNASFIGFTGTPLFKHDQLTRRIFGKYVSRYDFKRSEEDGATVRLIYENRGEKLGVSRLDLNDRIAEKIDQAGLDADQEAHLEKLLGKDYEVITADNRLDKIADDFVEHCSLRWESGKSMLVCVDKVTCGRMYQRIIARWRAETQRIRSDAAQTGARAAKEPDVAEKARLFEQEVKLLERADWMGETLIEIIVSEGQNEVRDFAKWGLDIKPHRDLMKRGFETPDGRRVDVETAFKDPEHPFRVAIVCAMWLTGFDVESLSTLYIDKPMKSHTLMQAIARANRVYPGKAFGIIVDYNGMLKSLRQALAQYALGDDDDASDGDGEPVAPIEELLLALLQAVEETENHLRQLRFDPSVLVRAKGFARISALRDAVEAVYTSDEAKRRFEILARAVFGRFRALLGEPAAYQYAERHDNIEAIYKKLEERRDFSDVTDVLKELHRIINEAIVAHGPGEDQAEGLIVDLSEIDFEKLKGEFARRGHRKHAALQDVRDLIDKKLARMVATNPLRMDFYQRYQEIVAEYNREKDRATVEATFSRLVDLAHSLSDEERRATAEGLSEQELALFDLLYRKDLSQTLREELKRASRQLLEALTARLASMARWTEKEQTRADIQVFILDQLMTALPNPPYTSDITTELAAQVFNHVWQQSAGGGFGRVPVAA